MSEQAVSDKKQEQVTATPTRASTVPGLLTALLVLAILYTLYLASSLCIPILLSVFFYLVLSPVVELLVRWRLPHVLASILVVIVVLAILCGMIAVLAGQAAEWVANAPHLFARLNDALRPLLAPLDHLRAAFGQVTESLSGSAARRTYDVVVHDTNLPVTLAATTGETMLGALGILVLTTFLLATDGGIAHDLARLLPTLAQARHAARIGRGLRREISALLATVALINIGLGTATGIALWLVGLPNPALWGAVIAVANFVPFIGPAACILGAVAVGFAVFHSPLYALMPALIILVLHLTESQVVTPTLVAMRLSLNPIVVFLSLVVWGWLWGVAGLLLALPIVAVAKIVCDNVPSLKQLGQVLGKTRRKPNAARDANSNASAGGIAVDTTSGLS